MRSLLLQSRRSKPRVLLVKVISNLCRFHRSQMHFSRIKGGYGRVTGVILYNHGLIRLLAQREMTMTITMVVENQIVFKNIQKKINYVLSLTVRSYVLCGSKPLPVIVHTGRPATQWLSTPF